ncbi:hypothetical protein EV183_002825 [Coemansia sp. RSA 2336]|nr:hypothetical protein EV183_002825 [Coemansia sp. RSA 2336]
MAEEQKTVAEKPVAEQVVEDVPEETSEDKSYSVAAAAAAAQGINPAVFQKQQSVAEKKARKALSKKGFEQVTGVTNLSVLRKKSPMFSIYSPDVYKNANSDTWIVFGEARVDNLGRMMNPGAQSAARAAAAAASASAVNPNSVLADGASASAGASTADADADKEVDETGVASSDIELVIAQANCSRAKAVEALKNNSNDVVNAIMELTLN